MRLGNYQVGSMLGQGGMGSVYRATQLNLRRHVALKVLSTELGSTRLGRQRFEREARVAATLTHPVAVEVFDVGTEGSLAFIAMELLEGVPLSDTLVDGQPTPLPRLVEIAEPLVDVLVAAHARSIVHRDLKPENVFVQRTTGADAIRVLDFGLAFVDGAQTLGRLTRDGLVVGTPAYLSPEQATGAVVSSAADIYSLGCMLYQLATGWLPFAGSCAHLLTQHAFVAPQSLRTRAPDVSIPGELDALVMAMLAKQPHDRPTAAQLREGIGRLASTLHGARHRGRGDALLKPRTARMVAAASPQVNTFSGNDQAPLLDVVLMGPLPHELDARLAQLGIRATTVTNSGADIVARRIVITSESAHDSLARLVQDGHDVVVVVDDTSAEYVAELLRLGVADVVAAPVRATALARKARRLDAKRRRRGRA